MCTSCKGCHQGRCSVMRRQRIISARRSWTLSKNASSIGGIPHCWGRNWDGAQPASLGSTPKLTIAPGTMPPMTGSGMVKWGSCEEALAIARDAHWQALVQLKHLWKTKLRGWATLLAAVTDMLQKLQVLSQSAGEELGLWGNQTKVPQAMSHYGDPASKVTTVTQSCPIETAGNLCTQSLP